jgi:hypothetical protein
MTEREQIAQTTEPEKESTKPDCVEIASEQSFPASDAPAWIFRDTRLQHEDERLSTAAGKSPSRG